MPLIFVHPTLPLLGYFSDLDADLPDSEEVELDALDELDVLEEPDELDELDELEGLAELAESELLEEEELDSSPDLLSLDFES